LAIVKEKSFKRLKSVKDDKFSIDKIEHYCLIIQIGNSDLQVTIVDTTQNRVLLLEDYILHNVGSTEEKIEQLKTLFESHHLLMVGFWKDVIVCFKSDKFALVPLSLFSKENARALLKMNCDVSQEDSVGYYKVNGNNSVNIFTYDKAVLTWFRSVYTSSKIKVTQQSGALVNSALKANIKSEMPLVVDLYIDRFYLHASVSTANKIVFFNSFKISKFDEYIKYIGLVLHEFHLKKSSEAIIVWGHIKENSNHFTALKEKFTGIKLGTRTTDLNFGYKFDEIPEHQYFDVFGNYFNL
jgi:hypothetical protein